MAEPTTDQDPPPAVPPALFPPGQAAKKGFEKIEDIIAAVRADKPQPPRPGQPPKQTAGSILDDFEKAGGVVEIGTAPGGGRIIFPEKPGDKSKIVLDPTEVSNKDDAVNVLIFELIRFNNRTEQEELDQKARNKELTPEEYATECERLAYKYMKAQRSIVIAATARGTLDLETGRYERLLAQSPTFEDYLRIAKETGHYQHSVDKARRWQGENPESDVDVDPGHSIPDSGGEDTDPGYWFEPPVDVNAPLPV